MIWICIFSLIFTILNSLMLFCSGAVVLKIAKQFQDKQEQAKQQEDKIKSDFSRMFGGFNMNGGGDDEES